jgi:hypothetical protein
MRRRHRDEVAEGEEGDATPDLLLKYLAACSLGIISQISQPFSSVFL